MGHDWCEVCGVKVRTPHLSCLTCKKQVCRKCLDQTPMLPSSDCGNCEENTPVREGWSVVLSPGTNIYIRPPHTKNWPPQNPDEVSAFLVRGHLLTRLPDQGQAPYQVLIADQYGWDVAEVSANLPTLTVDGKEVRVLKTEKTQYHLYYVQQALGSTLEDGTPSPPRWVCVQKQSSIPSGWEKVFEVMSAWPAKTQSKPKARNDITRLIPFS